MNKRQEYTVHTRTLSAKGEALNANCVDITFINYGTNTLVVNSVIRIPPPVTAGQYNYMTIAGNQGEIDKTKYTFRFEGAGGANDNNGVIVWREYKGTV